MSLTVTEETFAWYRARWQAGEAGLEWRHPFLLPPWLQVWRQAFAPEDRASFRAVREGERVIGIAPLLLTGSTASIIGNPDVCDYADFVAVPGKEEPFCRALLQDLVRGGVERLELATVRSDSVVMTWLVPVARAEGLEVRCEAVDVTLERELPATWDEYLGLMSTKQRHEVRRKLRRLEEAGTVEFGYLQDTGEALAFMDVFRHQFISSREDKAEFMSPLMDSFFRELVRVLTTERLLRLGVLRLDRVPVACLLVFDYGGTVYLYNSAYDREYRSLSVGVLSKVLCIQDSIERGRRRFDFLKGNERYKYHLAGQEVPLYHCRVRLGGPAG